MELKHCLYTGRMMIGERRVVYLEIAPQQEFVQLDGKMNRGEFVSLQSVDDVAHKLADQLKVKFAAEPVKQKEFLTKLEAKVKPLRDYAQERMFQLGNTAKLIGNELEAFLDDNEGSRVAERNARLQGYIDKAAELAQAPNSIFDKFEARSSRGYIEGFMRAVIATHGEKAAVDVLKRLQSLKEKPDRNNMLFLSDIIGTDGMYVDMEKEETSTSILNIMKYDLKIINQLPNNLPPGVTDRELAYLAGLIQASQSQLSKSESVKYKDYLNDTVEKYSDVFLAAATDDFNKKNDTYSTFVQSVTQHVMTPQEWSTSQEQGEKSQEQQVTEQQEVDKKLNRDVDGFLKYVGDWEEAYKKMLEDHPSSGLQPAQKPAAVQELRDSTHPPFIPTTREQLTAAQKAFVLEAVLPALEASKASITGEFYTIAREYGNAALSNELQNSAHPIKLLETADFKTVPKDGGVAGLQVLKNALEYMKTDLPNQLDAKGKKYLENKENLNDLLALRNGFEIHEKLVKSGNLLPKTTALMKKNPEEVLADANAKDLIADARTEVAQNFTASFKVLSAYTKERLAQFENTMKGMIPEDIKPTLLALHEGTDQDPPILTAGMKFSSLKDSLAIQNIIDAFAKHLPVLEDYVKANNIAIGDPPDLNAMGLEEKKNIDAEKLKKDVMALPTNWPDWSKDDVREAACGKHPDLMGIRKFWEAYGGLGDANGAKLAFAEGTGGKAENAVQIGDVMATLDPTHTKVITVLDDKNQKIGTAAYNESKKTYTYKDGARKGQRAKIFEGYQLKEVAMGTV